MIMTHLDNTAPILDVRPSMQMTDRPTRKAFEFNIFKHIDPFNDRSCLILGQMDGSDIVLKDPYVFIKEGPFLVRVLVILNIAYPLEDFNSDRSGILNLLS
jgi:hypothetical protein